MRSTLSRAALALCLLAPVACTFEAEDQGSPDATETADRDAGPDSMASRDPAPGQNADAGPPDAEARPVMQAQVVLERLGFGTGVIDGEPSQSFANALRGFQESRGLPITGEFDEATRAALEQWSNIPATRVVTIPASWAETTYTPLPEDVAERAQLPRLGYESFAERLAERFHTTPVVLARLNPGGRPAEPGSGVAANASPAPSPGPAAKMQFTPGQQVRVPNVGADAIAAATIDDRDWLATLRSLGVGSQQPEVARIRVDESAGWLKAYDVEDRLVAMFTVTTGSQQDPLPIGDWQVKGVAYNPTYSFNPELLKGVPDSKAKRQLPPGPNGPVGVVWIDLSKEHYGIHGTPAPDAIGRTQSNGCVRLTNWDAARLALMVSVRTKVEFRT
ncbi:MAG: L,D-transpeptidase family protein [Erythrobacter sp.]|uniref:L,D-transpeptidase family protein n=1 Tax=Erythrobacter sp. TaxID=1042 RepID=UPI0025EA2D49|nr:L,D-transpeptidase family protein [Erythrobacter sp.]MCL9999254.1 L,D-transpeptidase family protein [Erythrobacter sp.]